MITDEQNEDDDGLDEVYQPEAGHALAPVGRKTTFAAWHHPRKQFVRIEQWCVEVKKLIPLLGLGDGDPFKYLTLPGNELLDVRAIHGVCQRLGVKLRYLGFNSVGGGTADQAEFSVSQSEVLALPSIDEFSGVIEDRLEAVANENSPAFVQTRLARPFHAINLDLCDSIAFREIGNPKGSPLEATGKLLELQLQASTPWLLFITTKAGPAVTGQFARDGFMRALKANADASDEFRQRLVALISSSLGHLEADLLAAWDIQDRRFLRLFCAGLGKWLLGMLTRATPPRRLTLVSSCYYQSGPFGPDMLSLAFICDAPVQTVNDAYAILPAKAAAPINEFSEVSCALNLASRVSEMFDLDARLAADQALQNKLVSQAGRLLATARYLPSEYEVWAREKLAYSSSLLTPLTTSPDPASPPAASHPPYP